MDSDNTRQNPGMFGRVGDRKHSPAIAEFLIPITKVFWRAKLSLRGPALLNKPQFSLCPCLGLRVEPNIYSSIHCLCWTSTRLLSHCSCFVFWNSCFFSVYAFTLFIPVFKILLFLGGVLNSYPSFKIRLFFLLTKSIKHESHWGLL